jgi:hypothetical protein
MIGVTYILFCLFFITVFISNVSTKDGLLWMVSAGLAIGQSALLVPLAISCVLTCFAFLAARHKHVKKTVRRSVTFYGDIGDIEEPVDKLANREYLRSTGLNPCESTQPEPEPETISLGSSSGSDTASLEPEPRPSPRYDSELPDFLASRTDLCAIEDTGSQRSIDASPQLPSMSPETSFCGQFESPRSSTNDHSNVDIPEELQPPTSTFDASLHGKFDITRSFASGGTNQDIPEEPQVPLTSLEALVRGDFDSTPSSAGSDSGEDVPQEPQLPIASLETLACGDFDSTRSFERVDSNGDVLEVFAV